MKCIKCNSDKPVSLSIGANAVSLVSWCPDCGYTWTKGAAEEIATLQYQLSASQERERILREGLVEIGNGTTHPRLVAAVVLTKAEEVK